MNRSPLIQCQALFLVVAMKGSAQSQYHGFCVGERIQNQANVRNAARTIAVGCERFAAQNANPIAMKTNRVVVIALAVKKDNHIFLKHHKKIAKLFAIFLNWIWIAPKTQESRFA